MSAEWFKSFVEKTKFIKKHIKKRELYFFARDLLFLIEQSKEKRIEKRHGLEGMIKYCKKWYKTATGKELNIDNPRMITEKQQWIKFYDHDCKKTFLSDKYKVREYIAATIGEEYLVPLISIDGVSFFENANLIDFDRLPNQFVLSCNHGSSMTIVINDKSVLSKRKIRIIKRQLNRWLKINISYVNAFDFVYKNIKPGIIITKYMQDQSGHLQDYKFLCFNGEPCYVWIDSDRFTGHKRATYNLDFVRQPFSFNCYPSVEHKKPINFDKMVELARLLCKDFVFVRVDFYNVDGKIYFGELTFNSGAGKELVFPDEYNLILGDQLNLKDKLMQEKKHE